MQKKTTKETFKDNHTFQHESFFAVKYEALKIYSGLIHISVRLHKREYESLLIFSSFAVATEMADCNKVDDGLKKEIEAGKTLKDTPVPETGVNTHDATLAGEKQCPVSKY